MKRIILFPVILILKIIRCIISKAAQLYAMIGVWLWVIVIFGIIYSSFHQQWGQVLLFVIIGTVTFGLLFVSVIAESAIEGLVQFLS